jgi:hypothetical protein
MRRKIISLFTLLSFIVFSISCYTTRLKEVRTAADWKGKILSLVKTSGEYIEFDKGNLGLIIGDKIAGTAVVLSKEVEITRDNIKRIKTYEKGMLSEITFENGKIYHVVTGTIRVVSIKDVLTGKEEERIIFFTTYETFKSVSIPLSEVKYIKVKHSSSGMMVAFVVILILIPVFSGLQFGNGG